jgi:hypothetical protein
MGVEQCLEGRSFLWLVGNHHQASLLTTLSVIVRLQGSTDVRSRSEMHAWEPTNLIHNIKVITQVRSGDFAKIVAQGVYEGLHECKHEEWIHCEIEESAINCGRDCTSDAHLPSPRTGQSILRPPASM